jgi:hypothetical protein
MRSHQKKKTPDPSCQPVCMQLEGAACSQVQQKNLRVPQSATIKSVADSYQAFPDDMDVFALED